MLKCDYPSTAAMLDAVLDSNIFSTQERFRATLRNDKTNLAIQRGLTYLQSPERFAKLSKWRGNLRKALVTTKQDPDPILGEIRAFGVLSAAGFDVTPRSTGNGKTQDFIVVAPGGAELKVEVATKAWDQRERRALDDFHKSTPPPMPGTVQFREISVAPFGAPEQKKPGDTITANVISRLSSVKDDEAQLQGDDLNVLYLDLSLPDELALVPLDAAYPVVSWAGHLQSGELFAAFYGRRGMPVYEHRPVNYSARGMTRLGHSGRFRRKGCKLSAIVVACADGVILFENPWAPRRLSMPLRRQLLTCPGARAEYCWAAFAGRPDLIRRVEQGVRLLESFRDIEDDVGWERWLGWLRALARRWQRMPR